MNCIKMLAAGAAISAAAIACSADEPTGPAPCPQYLTLKTTNQGTTQDVVRPTYAYGWFGAQPRGNVSPLYCANPNAWHKGYNGECWLWWYK